MRHGEGHEVPERNCHSPAIDIYCIVIMTDDRRVHEMRERQRETR